jgi:hypothetical protein
LESLKKNLGSANCCNVDLVVGDRIRRVYVDPKTGLVQMESGKIAKIFGNTFTTDILSVGGHSGSFYVLDRTNQTFAIHKGGYDTKTNRGIKFNIVAVQMMNNNVGSRLPKNESSSKISA